MGKHYKTHKVPALRINLSLPEGLIRMIDDAADKDFTSRSDIIRVAVLWYLRPQGRDLADTDQDEILRTLQHRKLRVAVNKMAEDVRVGFD
jgi:metal-responsive CopG/Arc/MetJ family transcriptional regulator